MPDMPIGNPQGQISSHEVDREMNNTNNVDTELPQDDEKIVLKNKEGLSREEIADATKIKVTIADHNAPIVVFFGPFSCGKTMILVRLTRYLKKQGYTVELDPSFRPSYDSVYKKLCDNFDTLVNSNNAAKQTSRVNFMLARVKSDTGKTVCQILEGPGESYFLPEAPMSDFPPYVHQINNGNNRKIWAIIVEPGNTNDRMDEVARRNYVSKINKLRTMMGPRDKAVFVFNKIDESGFVIKKGQVNMKEAEKGVDYLYPSIFAKFKNASPFASIGITKQYDCDFVPFQTGNFNEAADGSWSYTEGPDCFPEQLWKTILKRIGG